jgi:hypothetical protein
VSEQTTVLNLRPARFKPDRSANTLALHNKRLVGFVLQKGTFFKMAAKALYFVLSCLSGQALHELGASFITASDDNAPCK